MTVVSHVTISVFFFWKSLLFIIKIATIGDEHCSTMLYGWIGNRRSFVAYTCSWECSYNFIQSQLTSLHLHRVRCDLSQPRRTGSYAVKRPSSPWLRPVAAEMRWDGVRRTVPNFDRTHDAGDFVVFVDGLGGVARELAARVAVTLLVRKFSHVLPHELLELVLGPGAEQAQTEVHVGKQRRERASRLQRILCSLLHTHTSR